MGKQWKQCQTLFFGAPKSLQMVTAPGDPLGLHFPRLEGAAEGLAICASVEFMW